MNGGEMIKEISTAEFKREVIDSDKPVLVDYFALWCSPCHILSPIIEDLSKEMKNIKFLKMDVDKSPEIPSQYSIMGIPTLILFKKNQEILRIVGVRPKKEIKRQIQNAI